MATRDTSEWDDETEEAPYQRFMACGACRDGRLIICEEGRRRRVRCPVCRGRGYLLRGRDDQFDNQ